MIGSAKTIASAFPDDSCEISTQNNETAKGT